MTLAAFSCDASNPTAFTYQLRPVKTCFLQAPPRRAVQCWLAKKKTEIPSKALFLSMLETCTCTKASFLKAFLVPARRLHFLMNISSLNRRVVVVVVVAASCSTSQTPSCSSSPRKFSSVQCCELRMTGGRDARATVCEVSRELLEEKL